MQFLPLSALVQILARVSTLNLENMVVVSIYPPNCLPWIQLPVQSSKSHLVIPTTLPLVL